MDELTRTLLGSADDRPVRILYGTATGVNTVAVAGVDTAVEMPALTPVRSGDYCAVLVAGADRLILGPVDQAITDTYSPNVRNAGRADVTRTVTFARYTLFNGWCHVVANVDVTSASAGSGAIRIDLPVASSLSGSVVGVMQFFDASSTTGFVGAAYVATGTSGLQVEGYRDNITPAAAMASTLASGDDIRISVSYPVV